jgi:hypothetical protein
MSTFKAWGGYWNVSVRPPESDAGEDEWSIKIHSHPYTNAKLSARVIDAYLEDPDDPAAAADWERELRVLFDDARSKAG